MSSVWLMVLVVTAFVGTDALHITRDVAAEPLATESWKEKALKFLELSEKGIPIAELKSLALDLSDTIDSFLATHGGKVSDQEVINLLKEIAANGQIGETSLDVLFGAPINNDANKISKAFLLLRQLLEIDSDLEAAGKPTNGVLSAMSFISRAIAASADNLAQHINEQGKRFAQRRIAPAEDVTVIVNPDGTVIIIIS
ncbi:uncharacterized protein LOC131946111 [Physella acuta]|uniref:uncharacterized protein LOC131946111 n=1 Tax=Physella acuta TaxID=109671 RepID=UPI0027DE0B42|nr:uncharacterized protein LOC131946111 [Physella acuta]